MAPPGNEVANRENKRQPTVSAENGLPDCKNIKQRKEAVEIEFEQIDYSFMFCLGFDDCEGTVGCREEESPNKPIVITVPVAVGGGVRIRE